MGRSLSVQEQLDDLRAAGHLDEASDSTLADLTGVLAAQRDHARVAEVREALLSELRPLDPSHGCIASIERSATLAELWEARETFAAIVSQHRSPAYARDVLVRVTHMFITGQPAALGSATRQRARSAARRPIPLARGVVAN